MRKLFAAVLLYGLATIHATPATLTGVVVSKAGAPMAQAVVLVKNLNQQATTGTDGSFSLSLTDVVERGGAGMAASLPVLVDGQVCFSIGTAAQPVSIRLLDLQGRTLTTVMNGALRSGRYAVPVGRHAAGVGLVAVTIGEATSLFKSIELRASGPGRGQRSQPARLARAQSAAAIDTLIVTKSGYAVTRFPITSYTDPAGTLTLPRDPSSAAISMSGRLRGKVGKARTTPAQVATTVMAVPIAGAIVNVECVMNALRFPVQADGSFAIELPKEFNTFWSESEQLEWVMMLLDTTQATPREQFMGFVSMDGGNAGTMLTMPVSQAVEDVGLDTLDQEDDELQSTATIEDNAAAFTLSLEQLREIARMDNAIRSVKNIFFNLDLARGIYYTAPPTFAIDTYGDSLCVNRFAAPAEFIDTKRLTMAVQVNTNDSATFDTDSLHARTQTIDLYVPAPAYAVEVVSYDPDDSTAWFRGYYPEYISSDSALNRVNNTGVDFYTGGHPGHLSDPWQIDIAFWVGGILADYDAGPFIYKKNRTTEVARYDWGVALPFDAEGKPIIYIATMKMSVDTATGVIDSIEVRWFSYDRQQAAYVEVADLSGVARAVSGITLNPWDNSAPRSVTFTDLSKPCVIRCAEQYPDDVLHIGKTYTAADEGKTFIGGVTVQYQQLGANMALNWWFH